MYPVSCRILSDVLCRISISQIADGNLTGSFNLETYRGDNGFAVTVNLIYFQIRKSIVIGKEGTFCIYGRKVDAVISAFSFCGKNEYINIIWIIRTVYGGIERIIARLKIESLIILSVYGITCCPRSCCPETRHS